MSVIPRLVLAVSACALGSNASAQAIHDWTNSSVPDLKRAANKGIKPAQLELGKRFEEGRLIERDLKAALKWYTEAGRDVRRKEYVYSPPVGNEKYGRVIAVGDKSIIPGLFEARMNADKIKHTLKIME